MPKLHAQLPLMAATFSRFICLQSTMWRIANKYKIC